MYGILLSRFTEDTFRESCRYRENNNIKCIYGSTRPISDFLPDWSYFVIEMNNTTNKIMGIGIITKQTIKAKVYSNPYFNRYLYKGDQYISADLLKKEFIEELENILFHGRSHLKRGGLTLFPPKRWKKEYMAIMLKLV